jgi:hypothetical protein
VNKDQKLPAGAFYAQFHHSDDLHHHSTTHKTNEWWDMYEGLPEDAVGKSVSYKRGGSVKKSFGSHPVHKIPGIHIVTSEAGEPTFTGER